MTDYPVYSGVTSSGITLTPQDSMEVYAGGTAIKTSISGGTQIDNGADVDTADNGSATFYDYNLS